MAEPRPQDGPERNPWTRLSRRTVYENPWITLYHDDVLQPDGQPGIYGIVHFRTCAVGVVALDEHDHVLLVGQFRYTLNCYSWEIPEGGAVLGEESPLAAGKRELAEETGYAAHEWREILRSHLSNSVSDEVGICFLATGLTPGIARPEGTEELQVRWVPFAEALRMVREGEITDSLTMLGLQQVALLRIGESEAVGGGEGCLPFRSRFRLGLVSGLPVPNPPPVVLGRVLLVPPVAVFPFQLH